MSLMNPQQFQTIARHLQKVRNALAEQDQHAAQQVEVFARMENYPRMNTYVVARVRLALAIDRLDQEMVTIRDLADTWEDLHQNGVE